MMYNIVSGDIIQRAIMQSIAKVLHVALRQMHNLMDRFFKTMLT